MRPPKPEKPAEIETPGLAWRPRKKHWIGLWLPRADIAQNKYPIKSRRLWPPSNRPDATPTIDDWNAISVACKHLQNEMLNWGKPDLLTVDPLSRYDFTVGSLVDIYLTHKNSPYRKLRHFVQITYGRRMGYIKRDFGGVRIPDITLDTLTDWYEAWLAPTPKSKGKRRVSHAHEQMTYARQIFRFGKALKLPGCRDVKDILDEMRIPNGKRRKTIVNDEQVLLIRQEAHRQGLGSMALAQTLQDSLMVRQKDAIGEWIPLSDPGTSDVIDRNEKWVIGFRWEEIDEKLTLTHRISNSIRGRDAIPDPDEGKVKVWALPLYPHLMEELALIAGVPAAQLTRDKLPAAGPMVVFEGTKKPWAAKYYSEKWRRVATAVGIPKEVQSRDTRAGSATHAETKGANIETIRQGLGHTKPETTRIYMRAEQEGTEQIAILRFGKPKP